MSVWVLARYAGHDELDGVVDRLLGVTAEFGKNRTPRDLEIIKVPFLNGWICPTSSTRRIVPAGVQGFFFPD
jgi:hypothetical protein